MVALYPMSFSGSIGGIKWTRAIPVLLSWPTSMFAMAAQPSSRLERLCHDWRPSVVKRELIEKSAYLPPEEKEGKSRAG